MIKLVRKSFDDGRAVDRSMTGVVFGIGFLDLPKRFEPNERPECTSPSKDVSVCSCSFAFRRVRNRFISL